MDSRTVIAVIKAQGWYKVGQRGSHVQFAHPTKRGRVTVPHPKKDMTINTIRSIEKQAGVKVR